MACNCADGGGGMDGARRAVADTAHKIIAHLSHGQHNGGLLMAFGNRLVEEAALLGGPFAEIAADFGEKLALEGLKRVQHEHAKAQEK